MSDADLPSYPAPSGPPQYLSPSAGRPATPSTVRTSIWLYLASIVLGVVGFIVSLLTVNQVVAQAEEQVRRQFATSGRPMPDGLGSGLVGITIAGAVFGFLFGAAIFVVFPLLARRGHNWARIVLVVVTAISLVVALIGLGNFTADAAINLVRVLVAAVATVLLFLPASNAFFRAAKAARAR